MNEELNIGDLVVVVKNISKFNKRYDCYIGLIDTVQAKLGRQICWDGPRRRTLGAVYILVSVSNDLCFAREELKKIKPLKEKQEQTTELLEVA